MDRGAWRATVHGVEKESDITERLNNNMMIHANTNTKWYINVTEKSVMKMSLIKVITMLSIYTNEDQKNLKNVINIEHFLNFLINNKKKIQWLGEVMEENR